LAAAELLLVVEQARQAAPQEQWDLAAEELRVAAVEVAGLPLLLWMPLCVATRLFPAFSVIHSHPIFVRERLADLLLDLGPQADLQAAFLAFLADQDKAVAGLLLLMQDWAALQVAEVV